ncbi:MAG: response regulator transcription factor [Kineosporiaceae bacterium]
MLVVDDDDTVAEVVAAYLTRAGHEVTRAADGGGALRAAQGGTDGNGGVDLVVLDVMLPDVDGIEVCRRLRRTGDVPVVMLTALGGELERILGLEVGADDYVTKPFSVRELVLRVESVLRRAGGAASRGRDTATLSDGDLVVDAAAREVTQDGQPVALTMREFDLLVHFLRHPRRAFTREELLREVWGWDFGDHSTVTVHVRRLRHKVEPVPAEPTRLVTVWGVGYRWEPAPARRAAP